MTEDRALEIIVTLGAEASRWPDAERAGVLALAAMPAVAAALADARSLDTLLGAWATGPVETAPFDAARLVPAPAQPTARPLRRWFAAGALAAAVAATVVLVPRDSFGGVTPPPLMASVSMSSPVPSATASEDGSDAAFAYVFTPTVDEDSLI